MVRILDSRRVTGPNVAAREPGAVLELALDGADPDALVAAFRAAFTAALAPAWPAAPRVRRFAGGLALFVPGPLAALLPLTDLLEHALACADATLAGAPPPPLPPELPAALAAALRPDLDALTVAARAHDRDLLVDDTTVSLGAGRGGVLSWPRDAALPAPDAVAWDQVGRVPIALVTGTNGKTTTARLVARIAHLAGRAPGLTSSDGVAIAERIVERGDFSGPEGARYVLRHPDVDLAILETARGGILRRGLAVARADVGLITNVSADHLGDYGIDDVAAMARVKAVVAENAARVVLGADDPHLVALAPTLAADITWFGGDGSRGARAWFQRDGAIWVRDAAGERALVAIADVPIAFGGRAPYNVANALAAAAVAHALDLPDSAIAAALRSFTSSAVDNPGRGNLTTLASGVRVMLDFGHNPAAIASVLPLARALAEERGGALRVSIGMPGDRHDADLAALARALAAHGPAEVVVRELGDGLLRGRARGEAGDVIAAELGRAGVPVRRADDELGALTALLATAAPGDLVVMLVHLDPAVEARVAALGY